MSGERRCEKCSEADLHITFVPAGDVLVALNSWGTPNPRRDNLPDGCSAPNWRVVANRDVLHVHCRTCQWWWIEEPDRATPGTQGLDDDLLEGLVAELWLAVAASGCLKEGRYYGEEVGSRFRKILRAALTGTTAGTREPGDG